MYRANLYLNPHIHPSKSTIVPGAYPSGSFKGSPSEFTRCIELTADKPTQVIGRSSRNEAKGLFAAPSNGFFESPVMSRAHAVVKMILEPHRKIVIQDTESMHGTFVNGLGLNKNETAELQQGTEVTFGAEVSRGDDTFPPKTFRVGVEWILERSPFTDGHAKVRTGYGVSSAELEYESMDEDDDDYLEEDSGISKFSGSSGSSSPATSEPELAPHTSKNHTISDFMVNDSIPVSHERSTKESLKDVKIVGTGLSQIRDIIDLSDTETPSYRQPDDSHPRMFRISNLVTSTKTETLTVPEDDELKIIDKPSGFDKASALKNSSQSSQGSKENPVIDLDMDESEEEKDEDDEDADAYMIESDDEDESSISTKSCSVDSVPSGISDVGKQDRLKQSDSTPASASLPKPSLSETTNSGSSSASNPTAPHVSLLHDHEATAYLPSMMASTNHPTNSPDRGTKIHTLPPAISASDYEGVTSHSVAAAELAKKREYFHARANNIFTLNARGENLNSNTFISSPPHWQDCTLAPHPPQPWQYSYQQPQHSTTVQIHPTPLEAESAASMNSMKEMLLPKLTPTPSSGQGASLETAPKPEETPQRNITSSEETYPDEIREEDFDFDDDGYIEYDEDFGKTSQQESIEVPASANPQHFKTPTKTRATSIEGEVQSNISPGYERLSIHGLVNHESPQAKEPSPDVEMVGNEHDDAIPNPTFDKGTSASTLQNILNPYSNPVLLEACSSSLRSTPPPLKRKHWEVEPELAFNDIADQDAPEVVLAPTLPEVVSVSRVLVSHEMPALPENRPIKRARTAKNTGHSVLGLATAAVAGAVVGGIGMFAALVASAQ